MPPRPSALIWFHLVSFSEKLPVPFIPPQRPAPSSASVSSPARHRVAVSGSSTEVLYNPRKPLHFSLLDADKLNPNCPFILPVRNIHNRCGFNLIQQVTVRLIDLEVKQLAGGDRGVSFYRTAVLRQIDHGSRP